MDMLMRCIFCLVAFAVPVLSWIRGPKDFTQADGNSNQCKLDTSKRYPELFQSEDYIQQLVDGRQVSDAFLIKDISSRKPFEGVCNPSGSMESLAYDTPSYYRLPQCKTYAASSDPCCKTEMYITVPLTVVSIYTGQTHKVKHTSTSYQLVHEASCEKLNAPCTFNGRCQLKYRIQWVLVDMPNGSDSFVPVNIPNHCYCMYQ